MGKNKIDEKEKEFTKRKNMMNKIVADCHTIGVSGILFHRENGCVTFFDRETDRVILIDMIKTEDEFIPT